MTSWRALTLTTSLLCFWAAHARPASTTETLVITRGNGDITTSDTEAPSTEGPAPAVELTRMDVSSEVALRYARTAVVARVRNPARRAQETTFHVLLPETAFISGFTMTLDGKSYKAYVKEKEEAKDIYNAAVSRGVGTALVSAKARDSNHFTVSVNIEPNTEAIFNLTYEELMERRNGVYNHAINLHPGSLVPQMTVRVHIKETQPITILRVPELRSGNEIDASEKDPQNTNVAIVRSEDEREATVTFSPDLEEQRRLMAVYAEKIRASHFNSTDGQDVNALGQFVVQYDVDRSTNGEILVNNGYFVHFFAPNLPPLPKHVVFVLDTSYSMIGHKLEQLKEAMLTILSELSPDDYFNIVEFETYIKVHDLSEADSPPTPRRHYYRSHHSYIQTVTPVCPSPATSSNIEKAKTIIRRLSVSGATNIYDALDTAIDIVNRGVNAQADGACATGQPANQLASTTSASSEDRQQPTPIVIFLTDGVPNVHTSNTQTIISHVTERNAGDNKAAIFSLAFGEDADSTFLRKLSLRNEGFMRHIYEAADAALQLRDFYRQVASPLLSDVRFTYPPEQVKENSLTTHVLYSYYKGSEVVVAGQLVPGQPIDFEPTIEGFGLIDDSRKKKTYRLQQKASAGAHDLPLERLWAYLTVKQLLDKRDAVDAEADRNTLKQRALSIALQYEFVTSLTSLVVVKPNATSAVNAESADKPGYAAMPVSFPSTVYRTTKRISPASLSPSSRHHSYPSQAGLSGSFSTGSTYSAHVPRIGYSLRFGSPQVSHSYPAYHHRTAAMHSYVPMNYLPVSAVAPISSTSAVSTTPSPLAAYRLEDYPWAQGLIDAPSDTLRLRLANGTEIALKLAKDAQDEPAGAGEDCAPSAAGGAGACTYLGRCAAARALTAQSYERFYCSRDGYAGVCCPKATENNSTTSQSKTLNP